MSEENKKINDVPFGLLKLNPSQHEDFEKETEIYIKEGMLALLGEKGLTQEMANEAYVLLKKMNIQERIDHMHKCKLNKLNVQDKASKEELIDAAIYFWC
jgi:hypothetical protein